MIRHQPFERVPITLARGKQVRCQLLDEMKEGVGGPLLRSRLVAMEVAHGIRFDTFAGTAPLKCIKIIISRAASIKNKKGRHTRVLGLYDIIDEPLAPAWRRGRGINVAYEASDVRDTPCIAFQEHMKGVLGEAGSAQGVSPIILLP